MGHGEPAAAGHRCPRQKEPYVRRQRGELCALLWAWSLHSASLTGRSGVPAKKTTFKAPSYSILREMFPEGMLVESLKKGLTIRQRTPGDESSPLPLWLLPIWPIVSRSPPLPRVPFPCQQPEGLASQLCNSEVWEETCESATAILIKNHR